MMDSAGQLSIFFVCVSVGIVGGFLYEGVSLAALPRPKKWRPWLRFGADILFFLGFAVLCVWVASALCLPAFREYYYLGFAVGLLLYLKTFHKAVAFLKKICYNIFRKAVDGIKKPKSFCKSKEKGL